MKCRPTPTHQLVASLASAQYGPGGQYGPNSPNGGGNNNNPDSSSNNGFSNFTSFLTSRQKLVIAHGVLAALAFVLLFPLGSILIRLGSFRGLWLVHGLFQLFAYAIYIAAFGIGVYMIQDLPVDLLDDYHPIIGIVVLVLLFFQPILGWVHHLRFKKVGRRTLWSHAHLWLGRGVVTLGMINGGLGMLLATQTGFYEPSRGQIAAYGVVAGVMWVAWVVASVFGERRRASARSEAEIGKDQDSDEGWRMSERGRFA